MTRSLTYRNTPPELAAASLDTPVGPLRLIGSERGLVAVLWAGEDGRRIGLREPVEPGSSTCLDAAKGELSLYFANRLRRFRVPLDLRGSVFQIRVWQALLSISFGETRSYGDLARTLGIPNAARAVGAANGRNPVSIIVPCHRLVGASGDLRGFAGGLATKQILLDFEARSLRSDLPLSA